MPLNITIRVGQPIAVGLEKAEAHSRTYHPHLRGNAFITA